MPLLFHKICDINPSYSETIEMERYCEFRVPSILEIQSALPVGTVNVAYNLGGVYIICQDEKEVYVGKTNNLIRRLTDYAYKWRSYEERGRHDSNMNIKLLAGAEMGHCFELWFASIADESDRVSNERNIIKNHTPSWNVQHTEDKELTTCAKCGHALWFCNTSTCGYNSSDPIPPILSEDPEMLPSRVTNFTATTVAGNKIELAWLEPSQGWNESTISGYKIERSLDNSAWDDLVPIWTSAHRTQVYHLFDHHWQLRYTDINLTTNQRYYYKVSAINLGGTGRASTIASTVAGNVPDQITTISATAQTGNEIVIAWTPPADNGHAIVKYLIEFSIGQTVWHNDGSSVTTSFTSTELANGETYYYRVTAMNSIGNSTVSATVSATIE